MRGHDARRQGPRLARALTRTLLPGRSGRHGASSTATSTWPMLTPCRPREGDANSVVTTHGFPTVRIGDEPHHPTRVIAWRPGPDPRLPARPGRARGSGVR